MYKIVKYLKGRLYILVQYVIGKLYVLQYNTIEIMRSEVFVTMIYLQADGSHSCYYNQNILS
jgi:hypothetical protein